MRLQICACYMQVSDGNLAPHFNAKYGRLAYKMPPWMRDRKIRVNPMFPFGALRSAPVEQTDEERRHRAVAAAVAEVAGRALAQEAFEAEGAANDRVDEGSGDESAEEDAGESEGPATTMEELESCTSATSMPATSMPAATQLAGAARMMAAPGNKRPAPRGNDAVEQPRQPAPRTER